MKRFVICFLFRRFWLLCCLLCFASLLSSPTLVHAADIVTQCVSEPTTMTLDFGQLVSCAFDAAGDTDLFRFSGSAGDVVLIQITHQSGSMRPCIKLIAPDTSKIDACSNNFANRIDTTLTQSGTYTILTDVWFAGATGSYTLDVERLIAPSPNATAAGFGAYYQSSLDLPGDLDLYTFTGTKNTSVRVQGTWVNGGMRPCLTLIAPDNSRTVSCNNDFTNLIDLKLNQTGTYVVLYGDWFSTSIGTYALVIEQLMPPSGDALPLQYGILQPGQMDPPGDIDLYRFKGKADTSIRLQTTWKNGSLRPCVELIQPDHTRKTACSNNFSNKIDTPLNQTGAYAVLVTDWFSTRTGEYNLELQCITGTCVDTLPFYLPVLLR